MVTFAQIAWNQELGDKGATSGEHSLREFADELNMIPALPQLGG